MKKRADVVNAAVPFNYPEDLRVDQTIHPKADYDESASFTLNKHLGQLKLFSNELEFLLSFVCDDNMTKKKKVILYIGSGPGNHLNYLTKMFPTIEWHLFDDHFDSRLESLKNVMVQVRYFSDDDMGDYKKIYADDPEVDLYLISDIRTLTFNSKKRSAEEEAKVLEDLTLQRKWIEYIKPKYSMIKFRVPFPYPDVIKLLGKDYIEYFDGILYKQPWSGSSSIETRIVIDNTMREKRYNLATYEKQLFYHNKFIRQSNYVFPMSDVLVGVKVNNFFTINARYDCAYIITLLVQYFTRTSPLMEPLKIKDRIIRILDLVSKDTKF